MGSFGQCVSIIAYNVNSSRRRLLLGLLSWAPAVQVSERRTGGAGAGPRAGFGPLLRASRVTLPPSPFYFGLDAVGLVSVLSLFGWLYAVIWGAIGYYSIGVPAALSRRAPAVCFSRARVVVMRGYALYTLAAFNRLISAVRGYGLRELVPVLGSW